MTKIYEYNFEKLEVWKYSIEFAKNIYEITEKFPDIEKFGLVSQIRRAVVSVSSNIAEGSAKQSLKDQARFTEIAFGSLMEILNQIILSVKLKFIKEKDYIDIREHIENLSRQLNALKKSQLKSYKESSLN